jgi:hypothetical protein
VACAAPTLCDRRRDRISRFETRLNYTAPHLPLAQIHFSFNAAVCSVATKLSHARSLLPSTTLPPQTTSLYNSRAPSAEPHACRTTPPRNIPPHSITMRCAAAAGGRDTAWINPRQHRRWQSKAFPPIQIDFASWMQVS